MMDELCGVQYTSLKLFKKDFAPHYVSLNTITEFCLCSDFI